MRQLHKPTPAVCILTCPRVVSYSVKVLYNITVYKKYFRNLRWYLKFVLFLINKHFFTSNLIRGKGNSTKIAEIKNLLSNPLDTPLCLHNSGESNALHCYQGQIITRNIFLEKSKYFAVKDEILCWKKEIRYDCYYNYTGHLTKLTLNKFIYFWDIKTHLQCLK